MHVKSVRSALSSANGVDQAGPNSMSGKHVSAQIPKGGSPSSLAWDSVIRITATPSVSDVLLYCDHEAMFSVKSGMQFDVVLQRGTMLLS